MTQNAETYRWNTYEAAQAFDQAAEFIHPYYLAVQEQILLQLPFLADAGFLIVDLGGGSGRLIERVLQQSSNARAVLVDQSEPFLALAERRLERFGDRVTLLKRRLQDNWQSELPASPQAIVSTSAIHHLDATEKQALFARCREALSGGGVFINGDEYRPESDVEYLAQLKWWDQHMKSALHRALIPTSFRQVLQDWHDRNIGRFGGPKTSGDDWLETIAAQIACLRDIGFRQVQCTWAEKLWGVLTARK